MVCHWQPKCNLKMKRARVIAADADGPPSKTRCATPGCTTRPAFGYTRGTHCTAHKAQDMVHQYSTMCQDCGVIARFGFREFGKETARPSHCAAHKAAGMVAFRGPGELCAMAGCAARCTYAPADGSRPTHCAVHRTQDMVPAGIRVCSATGCRTRPAFGLPGAVATHCFAHKSPDMVNVKGAMCQLCPCRATYGPPGGRLQRCSQHRGASMILMPRKRCGRAGCGAIGTREFARQRWCGDHAPPSAWSLAFETCVACMEPAVVVNGLCEACSPARRPLHQKEEVVAQALREAGFAFVRDRVLEDVSCGRERPDFQIDCGAFFVYVECDEFGHAGTTRDCEVIRMKNLTEVRGMPVVFVRFNPDPYVPRPGGTYVPPGQARLDALVHLVGSLGSGLGGLGGPGGPQPPTALLRVLWLFYDGCDGCVPLEEILM